MRCKYCNTETTTETCDECKSHILLIQQYNKITTTEAEKQYSGIWKKRKNNKKQKKTKKQTEYSKYCMYLKSNKWKTIKERMFKKHNYLPCCFCCGSMKNIQVHHKTYKNIYNENLNDLVCLCESCHSKIHNIISTAKTSKNPKFSLLKCHITFREFCVRCGSPDKAHEYLVKLIKSRKKK